MCRSERAPRRFFIVSLVGGVRSRQEARQQPRQRRNELGRALEARVPLQQLQRRHKRPRVGARLLLP